MQLVVLIIHLIVAVCLVGLVLLQRSEGGALGMGGGSGSLMSGRGAADALARMTSIAGGFFIVTSLVLTVLSGSAANSEGRSVFDLLPRQERSAPAPAPTPAPAEPAGVDPTQSSAPEAAQSQLASLGPASAEASTGAVAPPPAAAATRAAPIESRPAPAATQPVAAVTPAAATPRRQTTPAAAPSALPASARQAQPTAASAPPPAAQQDTQSEPESVEVVNGVEAVRRERAGPDQ